jgi:hypothetical protein
VNEEKKRKKEPTEKEKTKRTHPKE